jgi:hypothetical protein
MSVLLLYPLIGRRYQSYTIAVGSVLGIGGVFGSAILVGPITVCGGRAINMAQISLLPRIFK